MDTRASGPWAATGALRSLTRRLSDVRTSLNAALRSWRTGCGDLRRLAEERGALQYVATLVARGASPSVIFEAAAYAVGWLVKADYTVTQRYEADQTISVVTYWRAPGSPDISVPFGGRWPLEDDPLSAAVRRSNKPVRRSYETVRSQVGDWVRGHGIGNAVACPVIVDDRLWGVMSALYLGSDPPPPDDTEERMGEFVELLSSAIAQAQTHTELIASQARLVTSADATRRRIERDLHDGAQQHLVALALQLHEAEASVPPECSGLRQKLSDTAQGLSDTLTELQDLTRGLHPPVLARRGLQPALSALVSRSSVPVELHVEADRRLPEDLEVTLYYVVSEALTNVLKHSQASGARIDLNHDDSKVRLTVSDNGVGGADPARGSGLTGLKDRVEALGGTIQITSPTGKGTSLLVTIPSPPT